MNTPIFRAACTRFRRSAPTSTGVSLMMTTAMYRLPIRQKKHTSAALLEFLTQRTRRPAEPDPWSLAAEGDDDAVVSRRVYRSLVAGHGEVLALWYLGGIQQLDLGFLV